jgi:hypothetical protein
MYIGKRAGAMLENEGVQYRGKSYRYNSCPEVPEVPEVCYITDAKGNRLLVYKSEIQASLSAEVEMLKAEQDSK